MALLLLLSVLCPAVVLGDPYGGGWSHSRYPGWWSYSTYSDSRPTASWRPVEELLDQVPPQMLSVSWPNSGGPVRPNTTLTSGVMTERPRLAWPAQPGSLYTVMILDAGIKRVLPKTYLHWMVTNVPGNAVAMGDEVMEYVTPFSLEFTEDGSFVKDALQSPHPMILLVFRQPGDARLVVEETQAGCSPDIVAARIHDYRDLVEKYGLELVAGNYLQCPYSGLDTKRMVCRVTRCTGEDFPFPIPGVNDLPECRPNPRILDMTVRGPKRSSVKEFGKYVSPYSPDSVGFAIKDSYPVYSTGQADEFLAVKGTYNAHLNGHPSHDNTNSSSSEVVPLGVNNQPDTLEGIIAPILITYPDAEAAKGLFDNLFSIFPNAISLFQTMPADGLFKIVLSRPYDQDFSVSLLNVPGTVFDLNIVKVKEGEEEKFQETRERMIARARSSKDVVAVHKFIVDQDIMEGEKGGPLYFDPTNNEVTIAIFNSHAARQRAMVEMNADKALLTEFTDTFDCIMCVLVSGQLPYFYYPPFE